MAIFNKQTNFMEKYFEEYDRALSNIPKEELEKMFRNVFDFYKNYDELTWEEKMHLAKLDFQKIIEVVLNKYQDKKFNLIASEETIDDELQAVLRPMREGDVLFYSRALKDFKNDKFLYDKNVKFPKDIVEELEAKEFDEWIEQRDKEQVEYEAALTPQEKEEIEKYKRSCEEEWEQEEHEKWIKEHIKPCPKCGQDMSDLAPNGAGELVQCDWYCDICGWREKTE